MCIKNLFLRFLAVCSIRVTTFSACQLCFWLMYQEELPEEAKKLIKEKADEPNV